MTLPSGVQAGAAACRCLNVGTRGLDVALLSLQREQSLAIPRLVENLSTLQD